MRPDLHSIITFYNRKLEPHYKYPYRWIEGRPQLLNQEDFHVCLYTDSEIIALLRTNPEILYIRHLFGSINANVAYDFLIDAFITLDPDKLHRSPNGEFLVVYLGDFPI